jgi:hypothetical protein
MRRRPLRPETPLFVPAVCLVAVPVAAPAAASGPTIHGSR